MVDLEPTLLMSPDQVCGAEQDVWIGARIVHPPNTDGDRHDLVVQWDGDIPGGQDVTLVSLDPFKATGSVSCTCGWTGDLSGT